MIDFGRFANIVFQMFYEYFGTSELDGFILIFSESECVSNGIRLSISTVEPREVYYQVTSPVETGVLHLLPWILHPLTES